MRSVTPGELRSTVCARAMSSGEICEAELLAAYNKEEDLAVWARTLAIYVCGVFDRAAGILTLAAEAQENEHGGANR